MFQILVLNIISFLFMLGVNFTSGIFVAYLKSLGAAELIISIGSSALYLTRGTSSVLIHKISKVIPYKKLFIITFIGSAFSTLVIGMPNSPLPVAILRTVQGFFSGFYWVLINIYAAEMGSKFINKFKNLSIVTISLNIGGFLGSTISGKIASLYNPHTSFYIGFMILIFGAFITLFLKDIKNTSLKKNEVNISSKLDYEEKLIIKFALFVSCVFAYITVGIPLYILELGGSYKEIGYINGLGILSAAILIGFAPSIKKTFSYKSIMTANYFIMLVNLFFIFYFRNIWIIYFSQSIIVGIIALEKNLWFAILQEISPNYNKAVGLLKGYADYLGAPIFIIYGLLIQTFGPYKVAQAVSLFIFVILYIILFTKDFKFLHNNKIDINNTFSA